jgi:C4-dicarboxylate-specific signal transduction histidine kinase
MKKSSDKDKIRNQVIGLGSTSVRKNYYRSLMDKQKDLEKQNQALQLEIGRRREAEARLKQFNEELEDLIKLRTHDLEVSNLSLEKSLDDLKKTQDYLVKVEKLASLSTLVNGIAHQINTPIGTSLTTLSYANSLSAKLKEKLPESLHDAIDKIIKAEDLALESLKKAGELVQNFKKIAADQAEYRIVPFNFYDYSQMVIKSIPKLGQLPIAVNVHCSETLIIKGYPGALSQILSSLISNSIIHGYEEKHMTIDIFFNVNKEGVELIYQDDGKGCTPEELFKIFDPFYTTSSVTEHSGLGLFTINNMVSTVLKGTIRAELRSDKGIRFILTVPRRRKDKEFQNIVSK